MTAHILFAVAAGLLVYMTAAWLVARSRKRLDTVDTAYGGGFIVAAFIVLAMQPSWRSAVIAIFVSIWGSRLAVHLFKRSAGRSEDPRYVAISEKWRGNFWLRAYWSIFMVQAVVIWAVSLPVVYAAGQTTGSAVWYTIAGSLVWITGFCFERTADNQLAAFLKDPVNKGQVMGKGVWRYSRHPNYFGEITQWYGIGIIALSAQLGYIGLLGPTILAATIIFVSGIPPIERRHRRDPKWRPYIEKTSLLIPFPPKS